MLNPIGETSASSQHWITEIGFTIQAKEERCTETCRGSFSSIHQSANSCILRERTDQKEKHQCLHMARIRSTFTSQTEKPIIHETLGRTLKRAYIEKSTR